MKIGYARTSTYDQLYGLDIQLDKLKNVNVEKIFHEHASASSSKRPEFQKMMDFIREGDELYITSLDRIARSMNDLVRIIESLEKKGIPIHILNLGIDTSTASGKLILNVFGSVAQFEREIMKERQREGMVKAKEKGVIFGRPRKLNDSMVEKINIMKREGYGASEISRMVNVSRASVYRALENDVYEIGLLQNF